MSPGDFSQLGKSGAVAFRATFTGAVPRQNELYWRGPVLSDFDGRSWTQSDAGGLLRILGAGTQAAVEHIGNPTTYDVVLEPTNAPWLFALTTPVLEAPEVFLTLDSILVRRTPVSARMQYAVRSWLDYRLEAGGLASWRRDLNLKLPGDFNPETRRIARQWRAETPAPAVLIERLLALYRQEFVYTLTPPLLGTDTVDEFLWKTRRGFCEFYAGSFVFFMRAAGIPARVVTGYQGGERHPTGKYLLVHQYDAHAWAEVWLDGEGWVRIDPTAAVAPERIERPFAELFGDDQAFLGESLFILERYWHWSVLNELRLRLDAIDYAWGKWVLGYERVQGEVLTGLIGRIDPWRIGLFLLLAGVVALAPVVVFSVFSNRKSRHDELDRLFLTFCRRLARVGIVRESGEGPRTFAARVARERPPLGVVAAGIARLFERQRYGNGGQQLVELRRAVRRFRPR
ncbi:MAG: transglutaminase TgpA family protein, partial [Porticoccaceae bacterium]